MHDPWGLQALDLTLILSCVYCRKVFDPGGRRPNLTKKKYDEDKDPLDLRLNHFQ